ncbi:MAG: SPOR domain-containing protein [Proteobacteria bacterium]|nr:MAG: SPOR domain-containing protein [Pseudomonadota bacterium]
MRYIFIVLLLLNIGFFIWVERFSAPPKKDFVAVDSGAESLLLLSEIDSSSQSNTTDRLTNEDRNQVTDSMNLRCFAAGPYDDEATVLATAESIKSQVLKTTIRRLTTTQEAGYWVYIPALPSRQEALKKGRELAAAFVKDYYVVTSGNNENSISLGLYREIFNADNRVNQLKQKGFAVEKETRLEQWPEFWLDFSLGVDSAFDPQILNSPDINVNEIICPSNKTS